MNIRLLSVLFFLFPAFFSATVNENSSKPGIVFTENKGQITDQEKRPRADVLFGTSVPGMDIHLRREGISYQLLQVSDNRLEDGAVNKRREIRYAIQRIDINWKQNNRAGYVSGQELQPWLTTFLRPAGEKIDCRSFKEVVYKDLYAGIDLRYYEKDGGIKYDFFISPGADPETIVMEVVGADSVYIDRKGSLQIRTASGNVSEDAPVVFQGRKQVPASWHVKGNIVTLKISAYDLSKPLLVDPAIRVWGTFLGGNSSDDGSDVATDAAGNVFICGTATSASNIATTGSFQFTLEGMSDIYLAKFNSSGVLQWSTYYGGYWHEYGYSCATDLSGNVYIAGMCESASLATSGAHQTSSSFGSSFLAKFSSSGSRLWATYFGGSGNNTAGSSCSTDSIGNVYLAGTITTTNTSGVAFGNAHQGSYGGGIIDNFLVKFSSSGVVQWGTYYGGSGIDEGAQCAASANGDVYLSGYTNSGSGTVIASSGGHQASFGGGFEDGFLAKFSSSGTRVWATYFGGSQADRIMDCHVDRFSNVLVAGLGSSTTGITTPNTYQPNNSGNADPFVARFSSSGVLQWGTYNGALGGFDYGLGCTSDRGGNVYLTGWTESTVSASYATPGSHQTTSAGNYECFLSKFNNSGQRQWGTYYGGASYDQAFKCATDNNGNVYIVGTTQSTGTSVATPGSHQPTNGGGGDAFIAKFNQCTFSVSAASDATAPICAGTVVNFSATGADSFTWFPSLLSGGNVSVALNAPAIFTVVGGVSGCSTTSQATVNVNVISGPALTVNSGSICSGGSFTINASGDPSITLSTGTTVITPSITTNYTASATGTNGCISTVTGTVVVHQRPVISASDGTVCAGNTHNIMATGAISYSANGGPMAVSPAVSTDYTITGSGSGGCTSLNEPVVTVSVFSFPLPTVTINGPTVSCSGVIVTHTAGGANVYQWSSSQAGATQTLAPANGVVFSVTGTDNNGCSSSAVFTLSVNPSPTVAVSGGTVCTGSAITITPAGASTYSINDGSYTFTASGAFGYLANASATLAVTGTSSAGCISDVPAIITVSTVPRPFVIGTVQTVCAGQPAVINPLTNAQSMTITGSSFTVNPFVTTIYTLTGTSSLGCVSLPATTTVNALPLPTVAAVGGTICAGQLYTIVPTGNASSYSITGSGFVVSPSVPTSYTVTGYSNAGCASNPPAVVSVTPYAYPAISVSTQSVACFAGTGSGTVQVTNVPGPFTYSWLPGGLTGSVQGSLMAGTYTVFVSEVHLCTSTATLQLQQPIPVFPNAAASSTAVCAGSPSTLTATAFGGNPPYTFSWSSGATGSVTVVTPSVSTAYTLLATDNNQCQSFGTFTIVANPLPTVAVNSGSICSGRVFTLQPTGAATYSYSGGSALVSPGTSTFYLVTGISNLGCASANTATATITVAVSPTVSAGSGSICAGQIFTIIPSGAASYSISGGNSLVSPPTNTTYLVSGSSTAGCASTNTVTVSVLVVPRPVVSVNSGTICAGNSFTLVPSGATSYSIAGTSSVVSPATSTTYAVVGFSAGCASSNTAIATVSVEPLPFLFVVAQVQTICPGQQSRLDAGGAATYTWSNGSNGFSVNVSPTVTTVYTVAGTYNGCVSLTGSVTVNVNPAPSFSISGDTLICAGKSSTLHASGTPVNYTWSAGGNAATTIVFPVVTTTFSAIGMNTYSCTATETIVVHVKPSPTVNINGPAFICRGNTATLTASGAINYSWMPGGNTGVSQTVSPTFDTPYILYGTGTNGCSSQDTLIVEVKNTPTVVASVSSPTACEGATLMVNATGALTYSWTGGLQNNTQFTLSTGGNFTVTGADQNGCTDKDVVSISIFPAPPLSASANPSVLCEGESSTLTASGAIQYAWETGDTDSTLVVYPAFSNYFEVTGLGANGCTWTIPVFIVVDPCTGVGKQEAVSVLIYPNPNPGSFFIKGAGEARVLLYNELGQLVYSAVLNDSVEINGLAKGIYFADVKTSAEHKIVKVVVTE